MSIISEFFLFLVSISCLYGTYVLVLVHTCIFIACTCITNHVSLISRHREKRRCVLFIWYTCICSTYAGIYHVYLYTYAYITHIYAYIFHLHIFISIHVYVYSYLRMSARQAFRNPAGVEPVH